MEPGKSWHTKDYFSSWIEPQNEGPSSSAPVSGSAPATPVAVASPSSAEVLFPVRCSCSSAGQKSVLLLASWQKRLVPPYIEV